MRVSKSPYAVVIRKDAIEFPDVVGDSDGNPLVLSKAHVVSVITCEEEIIIIIVGGVHINVSLDSVYVGRGDNVASLNCAKDDDAFFTMLERLSGHQELAESILNECANELELAVLLVETMDSDNRLKVTVQSLIRRLALTEVTASNMSNENIRLSILDHVNRLKHSTIILREAKVLYELGCFFRDRAGDVQGDAMADNAMAKDCFELSALAGNADAQNCLGARYHEGKGVEKNMDLAFAWYMEAAKQGHAKALYNLGLCFENGIGCDEIDLPSAKECYEKALELGYKDAEYHLWKVKEILKQSNQPETDTGIPWGSIAKGAAAVLVGGALALADGFLNRTKGKSNH